MTGKDVPLTTTAHTFEILETVRDLGGASIAEITDELNFPKSTVHDYVTTLEKLGYLTQTDNEYDLSLKFLDYGNYTQREVALTDVIQPHLETVAEKTGETVWYIVEENGRAVYVQNAKGNDALQPYAQVGTRTDLHSIAGGKVILACLSDDRVEEIIDEHRLEKLTDKTITDRKALLEELAQIRDRGYALNWGENIEGWRAVASPVLSNGVLQGALAVAGPENRFQGDRFKKHLPEITMAETNEIQLELRTASEDR